MIKSIKSSPYISLPSQKKRLQDSKKRKEIETIEKLGMKLSIFPKVYSTSDDSELMAKTVKINNKESFLEIGTGCGIVSLYLSKKSKSGLATDINPQAVRNVNYNAKILNIKNLTFIESDVFSKIKGRYNVIIFNPPYSNHKSIDKTDKMYWDTNNASKTKFFKNVKNYLVPKGKIYFGWADFKDIDVDLPFRLAKKYGLRITKIKKLKNNRGFAFYVFELKV